MSMVFTFLSVANQAKDLTLNRACDFQTKSRGNDGVKSIGNDGVKSIWLDMIEKNDFTMNKPQENRDQALELGPDQDKCKYKREDMSLSRSSMSRSKRLRRKFRFHKKGLANPRTDEIVRFLTMTILNRPRN